MPTGPTDAVLYSFRRCPYAMRARMAVAASGLDPELREVVLRRKPPSMLAAGSRGTVPLLVFADGTVIEESLEIMDWALGVSDPLNWLAMREDASLCDLVRLNDGPFKSAVDRYKYPDRHPPDEAVGARQTALDVLSGLERALGTSPFLGGNKPTFFDAAVFPFVRQFAAVDPAWFEGAVGGNVGRWQAAMLVHRAFTCVMRKLAPWAEGDPPLRFGATLVS